MELAEKAAAAEKERTEAQAALEEAQACVPSLQEAAVEDGVTMFLSSFGGNPHEGLSTRVQGICDNLGLELRVVDFLHSPELRPMVTSAAL